MAVASIDAEPSYARALEAVTLGFAQQWQQGATEAASARRTAGDDLEQWWARAASAWNQSGWPVDPADDEEDHLAAAYARLPELLALDPVDRALPGHVLTEAALAQGQLGAALVLTEALGPLPEGVLEAAHPYLDLVDATRVRVLAFSGRISDAQELLDALDRPRSHLGRLLLDACRCLVLGNAARPTVVRRLADRVEHEHSRPVDHITSGVYMLLGFGLVAVSDLQRAARLVLVGGGGPDLERLDLLDRALGYELLVAAAVGVGDLEAAEAWAEKALPLAVSPSADSTVGRIRSRVALLAGRAEEAVALAEQAIGRARETGRVIEAAEGEVIRCRAAITLDQTDDASRRLNEMVQESDPLGYHAPRRSAARELRPRTLDP